MIKMMNKPGVHGRFKPLRNEKFERHDVFLVVEIKKDGQSLYSYKDYKIGSKIYKDYNEKCPKGHYMIRVIEY